MGVLLDLQYHQLLQVCQMIGEPRDWLVYYLFSLVLIVHENMIRNGTTSIDDLFDPLDPVGCFDYISIVYMIVR